MKPDLNRALIVGFGSPYGDDQFGWQVIKQLQIALKDRNGVRAICCDHSGVDWIHQYQPPEELIFVDAVKSGAIPGTLHRLSLNPSEKLTLPSTTSSHGIGLQQGLAIAAAITELPTEIEFYGVELEQCNASNRASPATIEQVEKTTRQVLKSSCLCYPS